MGLSFLPDVAGLRVIKAFTFVPLMFVALGLGSKIPLPRAIFHGLGGPKPKGTNPTHTKQNSLRLVWAHRATGLAVYLLVLSRE